MKGGLDICFFIMGTVVQLQVEVGGNPFSTSSVKEKISSRRGEKIGMEEKKHTWREEKGKMIVFPGKYGALVELEEKFTANFDNWMMSLQRNPNHFHPIVQLHLTYGRGWQLKQL